MGLRLTLTAGAAALVFSTVATARTGPVAPARWAHAPVTTAAPARAVDDTDELTLTLRAEGFTPAEVTRAGGRFRLAVDDRTGLDEELVFRLGRADGTQVREMRVPRATLDWGEQLDLSPGAYTLSVAGHPDWLCQLNIQ